MYLFLTILCALALVGLTSGMCCLEGLKRETYLRVLHRRKREKRLYLPFPPVSCFPRSKFVIDPVDMRFSRLSVTMLHGSGQRAEIVCGGGGVASTDSSNV
jgi:hypothetical protein